VCFPFYFLIFFFFNIRNLENKIIDQWDHRREFRANLCVGTLTARD
jgi:hypothetical protein